MIGAEAGVDGAEIREAAQQQPRSNQQRECQRHLGHHEQLPRADARGVAGSGATCRECGVERRPRCAQGRDDSKQEARQDRDAEREREDGSVDTYLIGVRRVRHEDTWRRERNGGRQLDEPGGHEQTRRPTDDRQHDALAQHLADEAPPARA